jgi:DHA2 family methylenomycin A resistance protein-like MFS transporter
VGAVLLGINQSGRGWFSPVVLSSLGVAVVAFPCFVAVERRASGPVLPLEWLTRREITMPCLASFAINFAYMGGFFLTPLFLEQGLHYSIGTTGFFQIARPLVFAVAAPVAGYVAVRTGERAAAAAGAAALVASMLVFTVLVPGSPAVLIVVALGASGLANGVASPSIAAMVAGAVDTDRLGSASATMQMANQIGVVAGIQVMETVQAARQHATNVVGSYHTAYLAGASVALLAVVTAMWIRPAGRPTGWRMGRASPLGPEAAVEMG